MHEKWSQNSLSTSQDTFWSLLICYLRSFILRNNSRNRWNDFLHSKYSVLFKKLLFQKRLRCYRRDLLTCTSFARIIFGAYWDRFGHRKYSVLREKIGQNLILQREDRLPKKDFRRLARSYRNNLLPRAMNDKKNLGLVRILPWFLSFLIVPDRKPKFFSLEH